MLAGPASLERVAALAEVDAVMAAIVGAAGLPATLAAARAGKNVLLANKEALVVSGSLFLAALAEGGGTLLPIDSEHSAVFQSLPRGFTCGRAGEAGRAGVRRILLTASGGPFRATPLERLAEVTPDEACAHPNWVMGRKISVDSATMMNKGLEVIEAHWLFGAPREAIEVVVHPQSVIHSMVEYHDGSVIAQLGAPDMRTPIACALAWPERIDAGVSPGGLHHPRAAWSSGASTRRGSPACGSPTPPWTAAGRRRPSSTPPTRSRWRASSRAGSPSRRSRPSSRTSWAAPRSNPSTRSRPPGARTAQAREAARREVSRLGRRAG